METGNVILALVETDMTRGEVVEHDRRNIGQFLLNESGEEFTLRWYSPLLVKERLS